MDSLSSPAARSDELNGNEPSAESLPGDLDYAAWIGIDWADQKHDICLLAAGADQLERRIVAQTPEAMHEWLSELRHRFGDRPVAVCLEQTRGAILAALVQCEFFVLYPVNPKALSKYREAFCGSGAKSDVGDSFYLMDLVHKHAANLPIWRPADANSRALATLCENRRKTVDRRTALCNKLRAELKFYYPQALVLCGDELHRPLALAWLTRFPTLQSAQRARLKNIEAFYREHNCRSASLISERLKVVSSARPATDDEAVLEPAVLTVELLVAQLKVLNKALEKLDKAIAKWFAVHPDAEVFKSLPGAGHAMAPRLLAAFGSDRERFASAEAIVCYVGIAPITQQSGRSKAIRRRYFFPTFLHQTFHEYAGSSIRFCSWAKAYYAQQRSKGKQHHTAIRALAAKWMRIIWRMWQDRTAYDDAKYLNALAVANSPLISYAIQK